MHIFWNGIPEVVHLHKISYFLALKSAHCFPDSEWFQQKVPSFFFKHDLIFNGFDLQREWKHLHVKFHITAFPLKKKSHFYKIIKSWTNTNLLVDFMVSIYFILNFYSITPYIIFDMWHEPTQIHSAKISPSRLIWSPPLGLLPFSWVSTSDKTILT